MMNFKDLDINLEIYSTIDASRDIQIAASNESLGWSTCENVLPHGCD